MKAGITRLDAAELPETGFYTAYADKSLEVQKSLAAGQAALGGHALGSELVILPIDTPEATRRSLAQIVTFETRLAMFDSAKRGGNGAILLPDPTKQQAQVAQTFADRGVTGPVLVINQEQDPERANFVRGLLQEAETPS